VLTCLFYHLALDSRCLNELQAEVDTIFDSGIEVDAASLLKLPYLESVINETMRMHPPVPSGLQRFTPREGLQIGEVHIPGNTIVQIPTHTMFRGMCSVFPLLMMYMLFL
jgi:cytochrome P450